MSYRDPEQALQDRATAIVDAIEDFRKAARKRVESGEWKDEHNQVLVNLIHDLSGLQVRLFVLARDTW